MKSTNNALLVILDGWGKGKDAASDALQAADTPFVDSLYTNYPNSELVTYGQEVGLPEGQMGNSEVGHLNIGAGRVVYQDFARINKAIKDDNLKDEKVLVEALRHAKANNKPVHLMGLLSDGGVHSHIKHLTALCDITEAQGLENVFIHAFLDGRDTDPKGGAGYLQTLLTHIENQKVELASVVGRYYAMDRDTRWERIKLAYDLLVDAVGEPTTNVIESVKREYTKGKTDEFMPALICTKNDKPVATINEGDVVIFFNYRTDRPRQLTEVLTQKAHPDFGMKPLDLYYVTMTRYDEKFKGMHVIFTKDNLQNTLGEIISKAGMTQTRIAETEKYPHVTFFFSGGREQEFEGEKRLLVASPKVATYDLKPEMSAPEVTSSIINDIKTNQPNFICLNYANTDMVGHTGDFEAAKVAAATVDTCLKELTEAALEQGYEIIVIADHGNSDYMVNDDGSPNTAHTTNPVPCFFLSKNLANRTIKNGKLGDIAPTILSLLGVDSPNEMTGTVLVK
ncbi:MAG: 2,3-bisphosphoglycerate-independent phosphoglycerate mutase [Saprospiraceae bacterium]|jgi:2,3-bisphosphoglycerate-independent phosphoglycerate mutase